MGVVPLTPSQGRQGLPAAPSPLVGDKVGQEQEGLPRREENFRPLPGGVGQQGWGAEAAEAQ